MEPVRDSDHNMGLPTAHGLHDTRMQLLDAAPGDQINYGPGTSFLGLPTSELQNAHGTDSVALMTHHETSSLNMSGSYSATELTMPQSDGTQLILHGTPERATSDVQCIPAAYSSEWLDQPMVRMYQLSDDPSASGLPIQTLQYSQVYPQLRQSDFEIQAIQPVHPVQITHSSGQQLPDYPVLEGPPSMRVTYTNIEPFRSVADTPENLYIFGGESIGPHSTFGRSVTASHPLSSFDEQALTISNSTGVTTSLSVPEDEETEVQTATEALLHAANNCISNELPIGPHFDLSVGEDLDLGDSAHFETQLCAKYPDVSTNPTFDSTSIGGQGIQLKRETCCGVNPTCDSGSTTVNIPSFFKPQLRFYDL
ncbi:unnamed protein product [Dicrocoelium dendriticum]|nr:unnamed protein product [Dicrocoelium dendriticum]